MDSAFTLVEVLAALTFMAIVVPVTIQAMHLASLSGEVAVRKVEAAWVADRVLNETVVTGSTGRQSGLVVENGREFRWTVQSDRWSVDTMQWISAEVTYSAQGRDYTVTLTTLACVPSVLPP